MRITHLFAIISAFMLIGCARTSQLQSSTASTRYQMAEAALRYLMDTHSGRGTGSEYFSAFVIKEGEFSEQLVAAFDGYKPTVKTGIQISTKDGGIIDKVTGKPVLLWSVQVETVNGNGATAKVSWHSGNLAAGGHTLHLRKKNGRWVVVSEKLNWIS